jgi:hypothetical protein
MKNLKSMKKSFALVLICNLLFVGFYPANAQNKLKLDQSQPALYLCVSGGVSNQVGNFLRSNNIGTIALINGSSISSGKRLNMNEQVFGDAVSKAFPDPLMKGIGVLDWEGVEIATFKNKDANDPDFTDALNRLIHVLDVAQRLRPNVSWGYYGLPLREFWNRNNNWKGISDKILPLLRKQDVLFPSLYFPYDTRSLRGSVAAVSSNYTKDNVHQALALGLKLNKPVMPFVWHRYPNLKQVPVDIFKSQAREILSENVGGKMVAGIIWWNEDNYDFRQKNNALTNEVNPAQDYHMYYDSLIVNRSQELLKVIHNH